jgi:hypothetical protein
MKRLALALALTAALAVVLTLSGDQQVPDSGSRTPSPAEADEGPGGAVWPRLAYPPRAALERARAYAARRSGLVSIAVIDPVAGLRGLRPRLGYSSASVAKALLLAAELWRLRSERAPLDAETRSLLEPMITYSDNDAADAIYARVGDQGLADVARRAGMRDFETSGYWGGAQITAADVARFFFRLRRNLAQPHRRYGKRLLASIVRSQRWGIPAGAGHSWRTWFKGGWRPADLGQLAHQGALLRHRGGQRLAIAVLSDAQLSQTYAFEGMEGVARRLLSRPPLRQGGWPAP